MRPPAPPCSPHGGPSPVRCPLTLSVPPRRDLQSQIWDALARIGSGQSWHSSGTSATFPGVAVPLVLLALLLVGTLLR